MASVQRKTLLLVEDEPTLQRILGSVLSDAGHAVETVSTAEAALDRLRAHDDIDLVLSDKNLPGMNGLDLLTHVRMLETQRARAIGFVLVTGYPSRDSAATVLSQGGDGYLVKPFRSLSHAVNEIEDVLKEDLGPRRRAAATARAIASAVAGLPAAPLPATRTIVSLDDPGSAARIKAAITRGGAVAVEGGAHEVPVAMCSDRVDRLLAFGADRHDVSRVLCDVSAPFDDLVQLIKQGGGAVVDAALAREG